MPKQTQKPKPKSTARRRPRKSKQRELSIGSSRAWGLIVGGILVALVYVGAMYYFFVDPFSFRWKGRFGDPDYPEGYEVRGIDVSHYQKGIRWEQLRNADVNGHPVSFVIVKATEGETLMDEDFNDNFYKAKLNAITRGAYHFYNPNKSARKQADFFLHQVHLEPGDLPPILDIETRGNKSLPEFRKEVKTWLDRVEKAYGVPPIIYTGYKFKMDYLNTPAFDAYPFWIAHYYVKQHAYTGQWLMWQYTDCGKVNGIKGYVDCNIFNGSLRDLADLTIKP